MARVTRYQRPKKYSKKTRKVPGGRPYRTSKRPGANNPGGRLVRPGYVTGLSGNDFGFPDRLRAKLLYADVITLTSVAGARAVNTFRLNSLFDPDYTGIGHQPQWYDQYAAVYGAYRVLGAKITCRFAQNAVGGDIQATNGPIIVGVTTSNDSTFTATNFSNLLEDDNSNNDILVSKTGGNNLKTITNTFSILRDLSVDPMDDAAQSLTNTNPAYVFYAHAWAIPAQNTATQAFTCQVQIEFMVEFSRRIEGTIS